MDSARVARRKQVPPPRPPDDEPLPGVRRVYRRFGQSVLFAVAVVGTWLVWRSVLNAWSATFYLVGIALIHVALKAFRDRRSRGASS